MDPPMGPIVPIDPMPALDTVGDLLAEAGPWPCCG